MDCKSIVINPTYPHILHHFRNEVVKHDKPEVLEDDNGGYENAVGVIENFDAFLVAIMGKLNAVVGVNVT